MKREIVIICVTLLIITCLYMAHTRYTIVPGGAAAVIFIYDKWTRCYELGRPYDREEPICD